MRSGGLALRRAGGGDTDPPGRLPAQRAGAGDAAENGSGEGAAACYVPTGHLRCESEGLMASGGEKHR